MAREMLRKRRHQTVKGAEIARHAGYRQAKHLTRARRRVRPVRCQQDAVPLQCVAHGFAATQ